MRNSRNLRLALSWVLISGVGWLSSVNARGMKPFEIDSETVGLWHLDERSGDAAANEVNGARGRLAGATWTDGMAGGGLHFDGSSHMDCGGEVSLNGVEALTVEAWIRLSSPDFTGRNWVSIVSQEAGEQGFNLQFYLGHLSASVRTDQGIFKVEVSQAASYAPQTYDTDWHHVAMTYDGERLRLYYDNAMIGSVEAHGPLIAAETPLWIGGSSDVKGRFFTGDIDEIRISNSVRQFDGGAPVNPTEDDTVKISGDSSPELYLKENGGIILFGNSRAEYSFDKQQGGVLTGLADKAAGTKYTFPGQELRGEWVAEMEGASLSASGAAYEGGECRFEGDEAVLKLRSSSPKGRLIQSYRLKKKAVYLKADCEFESRSKQPVLLQSVRFALGNIAIGGGIDDNEFLYPPTWLHFMKGKIGEATQESMSARYVYGSSQPTDKLMLPYSLIFNRQSGHGLALAAVNSESKVHVGALGGSSGTLNGAFVHQRVLAPGAKQASGAVYLSLLDGGWERAMRDQRAILMTEAGFGAPQALPSFVKDLVVVWHGIPGIGINSYDDLARELSILHGAGANAVIIGGKVWFCAASDKGSGTIYDYIPVPRDGVIVPASDVGGMDGFRRLVARAHELDMKFFTWGPMSMAGIARVSEEAKTRPDWWIYKEDGQFNDWYSFMAPANPHSRGWRRFVVENVKKAVSEYGIDGFWLDSSWQDHQLDYKAPDGWYGGPNGDKLSLIDEVVDAAKTINRDCVVMGEVSGAEAMSRLDIAYLQVHGIWPVVPPSEIQQMIVAQELCRLPGVRPFGQIELGLGFYPELADEPTRKLAKEYGDSWVAKTFLVSTLDRIPVYFGLSWGIDSLNRDEAPGAVDNPDFIKARDEKARFKAWFDLFKTVNRVRAENREIIDGTTRFDQIEVSARSVVNYVRQGGNASSIILLNADKRPERVTVTLRNPQALRIEAGKRYTIKNLMTGAEIDPHGQPGWSGSDLLAGGFRISLEGYEGAILKLVEK